MKISIITVCYNSAATLEDSILSVQAQSHADIEHILIDGASSDGTPALIAKYKDHFAQIVSEPDRGLYDAMNKGLKLATGDVIGILNSDDIYAAPHILETVAQKMTAENLDALYGDVTFFRDDPNQVIRRYSSARFTPKRLAWGWMPAHPTLFLRRAIYDQVGMFKTDYKIASDYELIARIFKNPKLNYRYLPEVFVKMRLGGVSTGGIKNTILLNKEVLRACRENGIKTNLARVLMKYPFKIMEFLR